MRIAISPCPNDTFIYESLVRDNERHGGDVVFLDIAELNALAGRPDGPDLLKVSCAAAPRFLEHYRILPAGGAFSDAIGPLVVRSAKRAPCIDKKSRVGLPGPGTSAHILWRAWLSSNAIDTPREQFLRFDMLPGAVATDRLDAAVVIHESRFTFQEAGLAEIDDLGRFWDREFHLPVPLGCLLVRRSLGEDFAREALAKVRASLEEARARPQADTPWIRSHAQEMEPSVLQQHISAYVTHRSADCGLAGLEAMEKLWALAQTHIGDAGAPESRRAEALRELRSLLSGASVSVSRPS